MRDAILVACLGCAMFVAGTVYGGRAADVELSGPTVDLPAAMAVRPHVYPDGTLNPDYRDAAILTLQIALERCTTDYKALAAHDAMIHRGACVPWED